MRRLVCGIVCGFWCMPPLMSLVAIDGPFLSRHGFNPPFWGGAGQVFELSPLFIWFNWSLCLHVIGEMGSIGSLFFTFRISSRFSKDGAHIQSCTPIFFAAPRFFLHNLIFFLIFYNSFFLVKTPVFRSKVWPMVLSRPAFLPVAAWRLQQPSRGHKSPWSGDLFFFRNKLTNRVRILATNLLCILSSAHVLIVPLSCCHRFVSRNLFPMKLLPCLFWWICSGPTT